MAVTVDIGHIPEADARIYSSSGNSGVKIAMIDSDCTHCLRRMLTMIDGGQRPPLWLQRRPSPDSNLKSAAAVSSTPIFISVWLLALQPTGP